MAWASSRLAKLAHGDEPVAVLPRALLAEPIWTSAQEAAAMDHAVIAYQNAEEREGGRPCRVNRTVEVVNLTGPGGGGTLRYLDLDVLVALSGVILREGASVTVPLPRLLRRMGYASLQDVAYDAIHASLRRLATVEVRFGRSGTRGARILQVCRLVQVGRRWTVVAQASAWWIGSLQAGHWQHLDLASYLHLRRQYPKQGLVRAMFAFLSSRRDSGGHLRVHTEEMITRFTPIRRDTGRFAFSYDNPDGPFLLALTALQRSGVVQMDAWDPEAEWWEGRLCPERAPPVDPDGVAVAIPPPPPARSTHAYRVCCQSSQTG